MVSSRLRKLDRKMADSDHFWDELQRAQHDPHFQPKKLERAPSERRKNPKKPSKSRLTAEAEERRCVTVSTLVGGDSLVA